MGGGGGLYLTAGKINEVEVEEKGEREEKLVLHPTLHCSGALCPDLKGAESLESAEAYFLIKERFTSEAA